MELWGDEQRPTLTRVAACVRLEPVQDNELGWKLFVPYSMRLNAITRISREKPPGRTLIPRTCQFLSVGQCR